MTYDFYFEKWEIETIWTCLSMCQLFKITELIIKYHLLLITIYTLKMTISLMNQKSSIDCSRSEEQAWILNVIINRTNFWLPFINMMSEWDLKKFCFWELYRKKLKSTEHDGLASASKASQPIFQIDVGCFTSERNTQNFKAASKRQISDYWLHNYTFRIIRGKPQKYKIYEWKKVGFCLQLSSLELELKWFVCCVFCVLKTKLEVP